MVQMRPGFIIAAVCAVLIAITAREASAADVRLVVGEEAATRAVVIEGPIVSGDFDRFIRFIREQQAAVADVYLFSSGGDFVEAMKIGRALRALELSSHVPTRTPDDRPSCDRPPGIGPDRPANCTCASACFFIHVASTHREGDYLAVHRPYFATAAFGRLSQKDAMNAFHALRRTAMLYMDEMGVPTRIQEELLGTPSNRTLVLDAQTVGAHFSGELPYRDEWIRNRCARLSPDERGRAAEAEPVDLRDPRTRHSEELSCAVAVQKESRISAYEKYFGRKVLDGMH